MFAFIGCTAVLSCDRGSESVGASKSGPKEASGKVDGACQEGARTDELNEEERRLLPGVAVQVVESETQRPHEAGVGALGRDVNGQSVLQGRSGLTSWSFVEEGIN